LLFLFDDYGLDTQRRELRRGGDVVAVEPKVFDLLVYLVQNRHRVVSRDDLIAHVWDGRIVSESAISRCINGARSAIGDSGEAQRLIKTLQRKGLRFVGEVRAEQAAPNTAVSGPSETPSAVPASAPADRPSIAVLPFDNLGGDAAQDYFSDGITEDIITELSRFSDLLVIARNSSFQYKGRPIDVRQVGSDLGVRYVLQGSLRRSGDRVRIAAQLADALTGIHRWAERYDRQFEDVFAIQDDVARTIAPILAAHVNKAETERTLNKPPATWQAYDYYLRASHVLSAYFSSLKVVDLYEGRRLLEQSLALDPGYARACAKLAWTHFTAWVNPLDGDHLSPAAFDRSLELARKAVELDHSLPDAHAFLGHMLTRTGEHDAAIARFERALELNPNFTDWRFAESLVWAGEPERAIAATKRHIRLDPYYVPISLVWLGAAHYLLGDYPQALPPLQECAARTPNLRPSRIWLAATYAQLRRLNEARSEAAEILRIDPSWSMQRTVTRVYPFRRPDDAEHLRDGLRKAGLPESPVD
jgi:adenylate cyclase